MRPRYESDTNLQAELEIITAVCELRGYSFRKLGEVLYRLDFAIHNSAGEVIAYAEVKDRPKLPFGFRDGVWLSAAKYAHGRMLAHASGVRFIFCVRTASDRIYTADLTTAICGPPVIAGRQDRGDPDDLEPCHTIPWSLFRENIKPETQAQ